MSNTHQTIHLPMDISRRGHCLILKKGRFCSNLKKHSFERVINLWNVLPDQLLRRLLPDTTFPILQGLVARVLGLWLVDILEHHKIDPMLSVYQFILKK